MLNQKMTYQQTLDYLYDMLPMFTRVGAAAYKANLDNTILLCKELGNPHLSIKTVHIAGTNGKGSCSSLLAIAFQNAGYKTGLYTSPHIFDFRERIKIDGIDVTQQYIVEFVHTHQALIESIKPSFFEMTVAMAFSYFAEQKVDIAIIEVGLGGLLDSTNIILPELSVITNISNDHAYLLGNTLQEIATQKAGIIKKNIPVVIGETQADIQNIFVTTAIMQQSPIFFADNAYTDVHVEVRDGIQFVKIIDKARMQVLEVGTDLMGRYQSKNIITVLKAIDVLISLGWNLVMVDLSTVFQQCLKILKFRGRFDIIQQQPLIILDVSHNEAGIAALLQQISNLNIKRKHIVIGFVKDKSLEQILQQFPKEANYYFVQANIPRALPRQELQQMASNYQLKGDAYDTITDGMEAALKHSDMNDLVLVTGSFFILEEAYRYFEKI
jgi:dihydrofolate synthase/folylpolyglutamate synthase